MNAKRSRRILLLVAIAAVLVVGLTGVYFVRQAQMRSHANTAREAGLVSYDAGEYDRAAKQLGVYVARYRDDAEVLYKYADAVTRTADANPERSVKPVAVWRAVVEAEPTYRDARQRLLEQYLDLGYDTEAMDLARSILDDHPDDAEALWGTAVSLGNTRRFKDALPYARRYVEQKPRDMRGHILVVQTMHEMGQPEDLVLEQASQYATQFPGDPRGPWLQAMGHYLVGNRAEAQQFVQAAAQGDPPSADFAVRLVMLLDRVGSHQQATDLLLNSADRFVEDPEFRLALARRLYEQGRQDALLELQPSAGELENPLGLALESLAMLDLGRREAAQDQIAKLEARDDRPARRWAMVLRSLYGNTEASPAEVVELLSQAVRADKDNAYLRYLLGEAYMQAGEIDLAVDAWAQSATLAPAWAQPAYRGARVLYSLGQHRDAVKLAETAHQRLPNDPNIAVLYAQTWEKNLDMAGRGSEQRLAELVNAIQQAVPGEPRTLAVSIRLSVRRGEIDQARETMSTLLESEQAPPRDVLLKMARLSEELDLGLHDALQDRFEQAHGRTPDLVYTEALQSAREGNPDEGLRLIEQSAVPDDPAWDVIRVRYLDYTDDEHATSAWRRLAETHRDNRWIQRVTLQSPAAWEDRQLIDQTIERLQRLTGEQGLEWRLARARWLLGAPDKQAVDQALAILGPAVRQAPDRAETHVLLAAAYQHQGSMTRAVRELSVAGALEPESLDIALKLSRLLQNQGETQQSREILHRVAQDPSATPQHLRSAATLMAQLGTRQDVDDAIDVLHRLQEREQGTSDVTLAALYRRSNHFDDAERVVRQILDRPEIDVAAVAFAADFYASRGREDAAERALGRLDEMALAPGEAHMIRADYLSRHVDTDAATEEMKKAVAEAPQHLPLWREYIVHLLNTGRTEQAMAALDEAKTHLDDLADLAVLERHRDLVLEVAKTPMNRGLVTTVVTSEASRPLAIEALVTLGKEAQGEITTAQANEQLRAMADANMRFLPLQSLMVRRYLARDEDEQAVEIASRAVGAFPSATEAAQTAAEAYAATGRWPEAMQAAEEWRRRSLTNPVAADLMIAEAQIEMGNPDAGLRQIEPYIAQARHNPEKYRSVILTYLHGLMRSGETEAARETLEPLLPTDTMWRQAWIRMAVRYLRQADDIQSWLVQVSEHVQPDAVAERVMLAQGWYSLWLATQNSGYFDRAHAILSDVADREDASAEAVLALAMLLDGTGQSREAEAYYRRALDLDPAMPAAQNNLAVILLESEESPEQAVELARQAVTQQPYNPDFLDTLALAESQAGNVDAALTHIRKAVELEPDNLPWRLTHAEILAAAGQSQEAQRVISEINARWPLDDLPAALSDRYNRLQSRVVQN